MGKVIKKKDDYSVKVTRGEFKDVLQQVTDNMNQMANYLMEDINVMFRNYVFTNTMKINAIIELLDEKGIIKKEDIINKSKELTEKAIEDAKKKGEIIKVEEEDKKENIE